MQPFNRLTHGFFDNGDFPSPLDDAAFPDLNTGYVASGDPVSGDHASLSDASLPGTSSRRGSPTGTVTLASTISASLPILPASPTPFTINVNWDSSVASAPSGFTSDIIAAVQYLETEFIDPVTININVGYNEVAGEAMGGALGESLSNLAIESYARLSGAVSADAKTATDAAVVASLPAQSPIANATYWVTTAQAKALGLQSAHGSATDGSVGFGLASLFTYGDTSNGGSVAAGTYDFFATAVHEITEVMGRQLLTGTNENGSANSETLLDLLHWSASGVRDPSASTPGYFSVDNGFTNLGAFNTNPSGDAGDWASSVADDPFDAFAASGVAEPVSANDLTEIDAIGWNPATPAVTVSQPSGVAFGLETAYLAHAQGRNGLTAGGALATAAAVGGAAGDQFDYALNGSGAASFSLATANGGEVLSAGVGGAAAGNDGSLYALTVTATDETAAGHPTTASAINVVVCGNGNDIVALASLSGLVTSAPTFIYGLAGNDTMDATGMTGTVYFDGGAGADMMTGGGGKNVYAYGGAADSTGSAMDIITNFNVAVDLIDLTGIVSPFTQVRRLAAGATTIAAGSIGWLTNAGDTFVYANTSPRTENLPAANMAIELLGSVALSGANFAHA